MRFSPWMLTLALGVALVARGEASELARWYGDRAVSVAATGSWVPGGYCGRGVLRVLNALGLAGGLTGANGHDWEKSLLAGGWQPVAVASPEGAPPMTVLVYGSDYRRSGMNLRGTLGGRWGHVELAVDDSKGRRWYVSDRVRRVPGGTVPDLFTGRAWRHPGFIPTGICPQKLLARRLQEFNSRRPAQGPFFVEVPGAAADSSRDIPATRRN